MFKTEKHASKLIKAGEKRETQQAAQWGCLPLEYELSEKISSGKLNQYEKPQFTDLERKGSSTLQSHSIHD